MNRFFNKRKTFYLVLIIFFNALSLPAQEKYPVPAGNSNQLFYLQRTTNTNTIVYELNYNNNVLDTNEPVRVYWIRYDEKGQKEDLNYLQRKFAYGVKSTLISKDEYQLRFVSYKNFLMYLIKGANNKYNVFTIINHKQVILSRIFVKIKGGSFWAPHVEYVQVEGIDTASGKEVMERKKI